MTLTLGRDVLLFFQDRDRDTFVRGDRHLRTKLRKATYFLRPGKQRISGFELSFTLLCRALRLAGQNVYVNDHRLARRNPDFPVGICGYSHILDGWKLPNPAVLGPGLYDHPKQAPALAGDPRFHSFLALCDWMRDMFAGIYGYGFMDLWFGGIDLADWPDMRGETKDLDVLVYDKIRWNRETLLPALRDPIVAELERRGLRYEIVRYGNYTHEIYRDRLRRSHALLFLCEHETQGMAYQEAMASNVPVLAWDQGTWLDPNRPQWEPDPVPATSVPYFDDVCGERFADASDFPRALDRFLERREAYAPRAWVERNLSMTRSAELYLQAYAKAATAHVRPSDR
jgi:hypothetical protein